MSISTLVGTAWYIDSAPSFSGYYDDYDLTFESNGNSYTAFHIIYSGLTTYIKYDSTNVFTRFVSANWTAQAYRTIIITGGTDATNQSLIEWLENNATPIYTVTFNMNGHGTAPAVQRITSGGLVTKPTDPTASGYTFGGWYKESSCTNAWNFTTDTVTVDTTIYAKWTFITKAYIGVSDVARKMTKGYIGVNGKARKITKGYIGVNGKAKQIF